MWTWEKVNYFFLCLHLIYLRKTSHKNSWLGIDDWNAIFIVLFTMFPVRSTIYDLLKSFCNQKKMVWSNQRTTVIFIYWAEIYGEMKLYSMIIFYASYIWRWRVEIVKCVTWRDNTLRVERYTLQGHDNEQSEKW